MPNATTLGFFMVAPISEIRGHLGRVRVPGLPPSEQARILRAIDLQAPWAVRHFIPRSATPVDHKNYGAARSGPVAFEVRAQSSTMLGV